MLLAQHGEGLFFTGAGSAGVWTIGGSTTYGAANAGVLLGGLVVAKAVGIGALALLLVKQRRNCFFSSKLPKVYKMKFMILFQKSIIVLLICFL